MKTIDILAIDYFNGPQGEGIKQITLPDNNPVNICSLKLYSTYRFSGLILGDQNSAVNDSCLLTVKTFAIKQAKGTDEFSSLALYFDQPNLIEIKSLRTDGTFFRYPKFFYIAELESLRLLDDEENVGSSLLFLSFYEDLKIEAIPEDIKNKLKTINWEKHAQGFSC